MTAREKVAKRRHIIATLNGQGQSIRAIARMLDVGRTTVHRDLEYIKATPTMPGTLAIEPPTHGLHIRPGRHKIEARARELTPQIIKSHAHLDVAHDGPAVYRLAMLYARQEHAYAWLRRQPDEMFSDGSTGDVHGLLGRLEKWEAQAGREEERLAITAQDRERRETETQGALGAIDIKAVGMRLDVK